MRLAFILLALLSIQTTQQLWLTELLSSSYKYLKKKLMPDRSKFHLEKLDPLHKQTVEKFLEIKEDGLGISYTLIYYNLMLNLERECMFFADELVKCERFVSHIQSIISSHVEVNDKNYKFPLIGEFYSSIFDLSKFNPHDPTTKPLEDTLIGLKEHFEGDGFAPTREALTAAYDNSLDSIVNYLNINVDRRVLDVADPENVGMREESYVGY